MKLYIHLPSQINELNFKKLTALNSISLELHLIIILALKHCCKFLHILFSFASFHMQIVYLLASLLLLYVLNMHSKEKNIGQYRLYFLYLVICLCKFKATLLPILAVYTILVLLYVALFIPRNSVEHF